MSKILLRHTKRNQLHIRYRTDPKKRETERTLVMGSTDDKGVAGLPQPEQVIDEKTWNLIKGLKTVKHWIEDGTLAWHPAG